jgi:hypothetical protein
VLLTEKIVVYRLFFWGDYVYVGQLCISILLLLLLLLLLFTYWSFILIFLIVFKIFWPIIYISVAFFFRTCSMFLLYYFPFVGLSINVYAVSVLSTWLLTS